jgi:tetratricopeptide (TPR) repeat protein
MRAYAELADIREARGDQKEADFYRQVVQAIRISEDADQYYMAGLLKRAIAMYQQGLDHFADAYCIQSRMAIQLASLGKTSEAAEHYRRAYELMPDSFGRVESHCFGCERVFDGEQAQSIAEKVFTQLVAERPNKPQVYYLLGYLQTEEEHYSEAWTNFQTAVRLDPDYLNAWAKLQETSQQIVVSPKDRETIALNILRLDPLQRHASADFKGVSDLTLLWNAAAVAEQFQPKPVTNLFPLTASRIEMEKKTDNFGERMQFMEMMQSRNEGRGLSPARAVAETPFVNLAGELMLNENLGSVDQ